MATRDTLIPHSDIGDHDEIVRRYSACFWTKFQVIFSILFAVLSILFFILFPFNRSEFEGPVCFFYLLIPHAAPKDLLECYEAPWRFAFRVWAILFALISVAIGVAGVNSARRIAIQLYRTGICCKSTHSLVSVRFWQTVVLSMLIPIIVWWMGPP